jgi:hypothetical protein
VPLYAPATAFVGGFTTIVGFQLTAIVRTSPTALKAVRGSDKSCAAPAFDWPGVKLAKVPVVAVAAPDQYEMRLFAIVSLAEPPPVVNTVAVTVATNDGATIPDAFTVTVPSCAEMDDPPTCVDPTFLLAGTLIDNAASAFGANAPMLSATSALSIDR